jgi:hypothetical protein
MTELERLAAAVTEAQRHVAVADEANAIRVQAEAKLTAAREALLDYARAGACQSEYLEQLAAAVTAAARHRNTIGTEEQARATRAQAEAKVRKATEALMDYAQRATKE